MAALWNRAGYYIFILWFLSIFFFFLSSFFSSPDLGGHKIAKNWPPGHHHTNLSGYIFATKARIDNRKKTY